jgi:hypothetical protein
MSDQASEDGGSGSKRDSVKTVSGKDHSSSSSDISASPSAMAKSDKEKPEKDLDEKDTDDTEVHSVENRLSADFADLGGSSPLDSSSGRASREGLRDENANASGDDLAAPSSSSHIDELQSQLEAANKTIESQT